MAQVVQHPTSHQPRFTAPGPIATALALDNRGTSGAQAAEFLVWAVLICCNLVHMLRAVLAG